jgi:hypothetical protein
MKSAPSQLSLLDIRELSDQAVRTIGGCGRWLKAVRRWLKAGRPIRSDAEVEEIVTRLCPECPRGLWRPKRGYCFKCGCRISRSRNGFLNKARMATEHCPLKTPVW